MNTLFKTVRHDLVILHSLQRAPKPFRRHPGRVLRKGFQFFRIPHKRVQQCIQRFHLLPVVKSAADIQQCPDLPFSPECPFFQRVKFQSDLFSFCALFLLKDHHDFAALVRPAFFPDDPPIQKRLPFSFVPAMYPRQILEELLRRVILEVSDYTIILRRRKLLPILVCFHQQGVVNTASKPLVTHLSSASDNLQLKNAKKAQKYAISELFLCLESPDSDGEI